MNLAAEGAGEPADFIVCWDFSVRHDGECPPIPAPDGSGTPPPPGPYTPAPTPGDHPERYTSEEWVEILARLKAEQETEQGEAPKTKWWEGPAPVLVAIGLGLLALFRKGA